MSQNALEGPRPPFSLTPKTPGSRTLPEPRRPIPPVRHAAVREPEQACVIARCGKHRAWFAILLIQQDAETWKAVRATAISDREAILANADSSGPAGLGARSRVTGTLAFSVACPYCAVKKYGLCACGTLGCHGEARCHDGHTDMYCSVCCTWRCMTGGGVRELEAIRGSRGAATVGPQGKASVSSVPALPPAGRPALPHQAEG
jgi:hypothetical protein